MPLHDSITGFGGFAPFPNSIMIPFMGTQSAVLGYQFGLNYELGKRTVKAMDNDLFNKIVSGSTHEFNIIRNGIEMKVQANQYLSVLVKGHHQQQIDDFQEMIPSAMILQNTIIEKSVEIETMKAQRTPSATKEIFDAFADGFLTLKGEQAFDLQKMIESFFGGIMKSNVLETEAEKRRGGDPTADDKEPEPKDDGKRFDKTEPDPLPTGFTPPGKEPEPAADLQKFKIKVTAAEWGLWELEETHTRSDWDKIIRHWHSLAISESSINGKFHIIWRALRKAYVFFYGSESR